MVKSMLLALQQRNSSIKNLPRLLNHFQDSQNYKKLKQTKFHKLLSLLFYQTLIFQHLLVHLAQDPHFGYEDFNFLINLLYYIHPMILMPLICIITLSFCEAECRNDKRLFVSIYLVIFDRMYVKYKYIVFE